MLMPQNENHLTQKSGRRAIRGGCANKIWMAWHQEQLEKDSQARSTDRANLSKSRRTTFGKAETIYDLNQVAFGDWNRSEVSEYDEYPGQARTIPRGVSHRSVRGAFSRGIFTPDISSHRSSNQRSRTSPS